jgi:hypothetical protein
MNEQESNAGTKIKALEDKHVELTEKLVKMKGEIKEKTKELIEAKKLVESVHKIAARVYWVISGL